MIAFDEARFILQAAADQPRLLSLQWFGTDTVAFSPLITDDPAALEVAQQVQLSATIFTGSAFLPRSPPPPDHTLLHVFILWSLML